LQRTHCPDQSGTIRNTVTSRNTDCPLPIDYRNKQPLALRHKPDDYAVQNYWLGGKKI